MNHQAWLNVRNYLYPMSIAEMQKEYELAVKKGCHNTALLIIKYIKECEKTENT